MALSNAEAKKKRDEEKRRNAFKNRRHETINASEQTYNTFEYKKITILLEDRGYAFDYVKQLLRSVYSDLNFELIGANGEGAIKHIISFIHADFLIVVYDKSSDLMLTKSILTEIKKFKQVNPKATVVKITPKSFEEIILSYINIKDILHINNAKGRQLLEEINDYVTGKREDYPLANYVVNEKRVTDDMILEDWVEIMTDATSKDVKVLEGIAYACSHVPSYISDCWWNQCNNSCRNTKNGCKSITLTPIEGYTTKSEIEFVALNSLAYYIIKAIDDYVGNKYRKTNCHLLKEKNIMEKM